MLTSRAADRHGPEGRHAGRAGLIVVLPAPTVAAVELAERAGITLVALAKGDRFEVFSHSDRLMTEDSHVR